MSDNNKATWVCCQLGAREHYAVPRALHRRRLLGELITDFWFSPGAIADSFSNGFSDRFHPELKNFKVHSDNFSCALFELKSRLRKQNGWQLIQKRNDWFQDLALSKLERFSPAQDEPVKVFAYSYAASRIFKLAKERSWTTVLGQIDPGPAEERIVGRLHEEAGQREIWKPAPAAYWDDWQVECELADQIVVNSDWSRNALVSEGVPEEKVTVIPLAFEATAEAITFKRNYPNAFTVERPLRVLFLGQVNLRKGVRELLEAAQLLRGQPVEFCFVGPVQYALPSEMQTNAAIKWLGVVPRAEVSKYYKAADLFVFPTLSDGFGLTQLEAQSWKLPIIASSNCGQVVSQGINGEVLNEVSGESIAATIRSLLNAPEQLQRMSDQSVLADRFSLESLSSRLIAS